MPGDAWSPVEVEAVVADYFRMLALELAGQAYVKAQHRRALLPKLHDRSEGSVERKYQNISAIRIELGAPWIIGYKPLANYQVALYGAVASRLAKDERLDQIAAEAVERPAVTPGISDYQSLLVDAPACQDAGAPAVIPYALPAEGLRRDYLGLEARNRSLGHAGPTGYTSTMASSLFARRSANSAARSNPATM